MTRATVQGRDPKHGRIMADVLLLLGGVEGVRLALFEDGHSDAMKIGGTTITLASVTVQRGGGRRLTIRSGPRGDAMQRREDEA